MNVFLYSFLTIAILYSKGFCTEIQKSPHSENNFTKKIIKEPKKNNTKKENPLSEEDLKRLIESAYSPKERTIKRVDQEKDIVFFETDQ